MPELPEITVLARQMRQVLVGKTIIVGSCSAKRFLSLISLISASNEEGLCQSSQAVFRRPNGTNSARYVVVRATRVTLCSDVARAARTVNLLRIPVANHRCVLLFTAHDATS